MYNPYLITPVVSLAYEIDSPRSEDVITLAELKASLRLDPLDTSEDAILEIYIDVAHEYIEKKTGTTLIATGFTTYRDEAFPCPIELRKTPILDFGSLGYYNTAGVLQSVAIDTYYQHVKSNTYGFLRRLPGTTLPTDIREDRPQCFSINFTAGYLTAASVPAPLRQAALLIAAALYANRGDCSSGSSAGGDCDALAPGAAKAILNMYAVKNVTGLPTFPSIRF